PIEHDVIERNFAPAIFRDDIEQLLLARIALAALPEAVRPFRQHDGFACELAITRDHVILRLARDEIVVDRARHVGRERDRTALGFGQRIVVEQRDVAALGNPLELEPDRRARLHRHFDIVIPRVPVLPPAIEHQLAVEVHLEVAARVHAKLVYAVLRAFERSFPGHRLVVQDVRRGTGRGLLCLERFLRPREAVANVLVVDVLLDALQLQLAVDEVARREAALFSVRVAALEIAGSKPVRLRIADARDAVVVPQDAVVACRDDEGYGDTYVVLGELDVLAVEVDLSVLMLPGTIERLVRAGIETPRDAERGLLARGLRKKHVAVGILETDGTVRERDVR